MALTKYESTKKKPILIFYTKSCLYVKEKKYIMFMFFIYKNSAKP